MVTTGTNNDNNQWGQKLEPAMPIEGSWDVMQGGKRRDIPPRPSISNAYVSSPSRFGHGRGTERAQKLSSHASSCYDSRESQNRSCWEQPGHGRRGVVAKFIEQDDDSSSEWCVPPDLRQVGQPTLRRNAGCNSRLHERCRFFPVSAVWSVSIFSVCSLVSQHLGASVGPFMMEAKDSYLWIGPLAGLLEALVEPKKTPHVPWVHLQVLPDDCINRESMVDHG